MKREVFEVNIDFYEEEGNWAEGYCECGEILTNDFKYCPECGIKLLWVIPEKEEI